MELLIPLAVLVLAVIAAGLIARKVVHVCQPNEVLLFTGSRYRSGNKIVGYHLVQGGRGFCTPLLEKVHRLDLSNMAIDLRIEGAYSKGGIPLNVEGMANVKIASEQPTIDNAIQRFLGKSRGEIMHIAKETLEGNLRGVLATLTPEEVNEDRVKFASSLLGEADQDLKRLGLVLDTLKIQHVSDDRGYLDALGRKRSANLEMSARIAEANNKAIAQTRAAENLREKEIARIDAEMKLSHADAQRRVVDAQTKQEAMIAEQRGYVQAQIARAHGEVEVQQHQIERVKLQLEADKIKKAEAQRSALIDRARGNAASIVEDGKAQARALRTLARSWEAAGEDAGRIFMAQKLKGLVAQMMSTVAQAKVAKITVIDAALNKGGDNLTTKALVASEQLKQTLGVDVPAMLSRFGSQPETRR